MTDEKGDIFISHEPVKGQIRFVILLNENDKDD